MFRTEHFGFKKEHVSHTQWDIYCRTEGILHRNIDLLDSSMIETKQRRIKRRK